MHAHFSLPIISRQYIKASRELIDAVQHGATVNASFLPYSDGYNAVSVSDPYPTKL